MTPAAPASGRSRAAAFLSMVIAVLPAAMAAAAPELPLDSIKLPPGFTISVFAANVPNARAMALSDNGTLFVGSREAGSVYAVRTRDGAAVETATIATGPRHARRRRVPQRSAVRLRSVAHPALRRDRSATSAEPRKPGRRYRPLSHGDAPRLEVHRLRARRQALRARGRAVQRLRARPRPLRQSSCA